MNNQPHGRIDTGKPEHAAGPWTVEEYGDDESPALVIHKDSETRICFMATPGSLGDPAEIEANARLIAAAPDMLKALEAVEEWWLSEGMKHFDGAPYAIFASRAAIAKARDHRVGDHPADYTPSPLPEPPPIGDGFKSVNRKDQGQTVRQDDDGWDAAIAKARGGANAE